MTYEQALAEHRKIGASRASDPAVMAGYCADLLQLVAGAVSPRLVWEGAYARGMTHLELARLAGSGPGALDDLMWG